jgi:hypothetical protein
MAPLFCYLCEPRLFPRPVMPARERAWPGFGAVVSISDILTVDVEPYSGIALSSAI